MERTCKNCKYWNKGECLNIEKRKYILPQLKLCIIASKDFKCKLWEKVNIKEK